MPPRERPPRYQATATGGRPMAPQYQLTCYMRDNLLASFTGKNAEESPGKTPLNHMEKSWSIAIKWRVKSIIFTTLNISIRHAIKSPVGP
jgi:hypothetical protein